MNRGHHHHAKLPSLQAIGRSSAFTETDTPPPINYDDVENFISVELPHLGYSQVEEGFTVQDGEQTHERLHKYFHIYNPGSHVCKRQPDFGGGTHFEHCRYGTVIAKDYKWLSHLIEKHQRLEFMHDCLSRVKSLKTFVHELELTCMDELNIYNAITHNRLKGQQPTTKLFTLNFVCEELRAHVGHWNQLKQRWHMERYLRSLHHSQYITLQSIQRTVTQLRNTALFWIQHFIHIGFVIFAHCDLYTISDCVFWNIIRGLEDYNTILSGIGNVTSGSTSDGTRAIGSCRLLQTLPMVFHNRSPTKLSQDRFRDDLSQAQSNGCNSINPIPLPHILRIFADQRARLATLKTRVFFTQNEQFLNRVKSSNLPSYSWYNCIPSSNNPGRVSSVANHNSIKTDTSVRVADNTAGLVGGAQNETSDYQTGSSPTGSMASLSLALLRVGSMSAPDLSTEPSPLVDFVEFERSFIGRFLQTVCNFSNLLCKNGPSSSSVKRKATKSKSNKNVRSPTKGRPPRGPVDENALSRVDSRRKTVSWCDANETAVQLNATMTAFYMEILWSNFSKHLSTVFCESVWEDKINDRVVTGDHLGTTYTCSDMMVMIIRHMMEHVLLKDLFPQGSVDCLLHFSTQLHFTAAVTAWDTALCSASASIISDKCLPCPLVGGDYSSRTAKLLRDSYHPLVSVLHELTIPTQEGKEILPRPVADVRMLANICNRLLISCRLAHHWCSTQTQKHLTSWSIGAFLLITQADLKLLADETLRCGRLAEQLYKAKHEETVAGGKNSRPLLELGALSVDLQDITAQLQALSGTAKKKFSDQCSSMSVQLFSTTMPSGKVWRRRNDHENITKHNDYIEQAVDAILSTVISGVENFKVTSQISAISMATVAMCEAWLSFILKEKIKFSHSGAEQLSVDFDFLKKWLCESLSNEEVRHTIMQLSVLRRFNGIITLLKRQPAKGVRENTSVLEELSQCCDTSLTNIQSLTANTSMTTIDRDESGYYENNDDNQADLFLVKNVEQWLSLRAHAGNPRWKLTSCFQSRSTDV